jgi:alpha-L-arabinofuranosidase
MNHNLNRRTFLSRVTAATFGLGVLARGNAADPANAPTSGVSPIVLDPAPQFELSPYLYMQFMEPLGTTDGSVAAAWNYQRRQWREDVLQVTQQLAPTMMRWGGCFSSYYRWKEAVGPRSQRVPMHNLLWGGREDNQVGTVEFVDFCRQVGAESLMCVNFESDGRQGWTQDYDGRPRSGDANEAAEWVAYCNQPNHPLRLSHGIKDPCPIRFWQLGNETSYDKNGFNVESAARKTVEFARAMRQSDPHISLVGWGDSGWAKRMIEVAGEHLQYVAFHHMFAPGGKESVLRNHEYRKDPAKTWDQLMAAYRPHEAKIQSLREQVAGTRIPLALTECHLALPGRNRCEVLSTWAAGVAMARMLNVHTRHGDVLKIATAADFCGTRWQVNAVMIPTPGGKSYLQPVAQVMRLYRHHVGRQAIKVIRCPDGLDITAGRTDNRLYLHVVNTHRARSVDVQLEVPGQAVKQATAFEIAADPEFEIMQTCPEAFDPVKRPLTADGSWRVPAASVSALEVELA